MRRHDGRAGIARADERAGVAARHGIGRLPNRCSRFSAQCARRRFAHADDIGRVDHPNVELAGVGMPRERGVNDVRASGQDQTNVEVTGGRQRAIDNAARGVVAPHRVDCNAHECGRWSLVVGHWFSVVSRWQ